MKSAKKRKKTNKNNHLRRLFIGARMEFDGNEDNGQIAEFANGEQFGVRDVDFIIKNLFFWRICVKFEFVNEFNHRRTYEETFKTSKIRFNELKDYADELCTKAGLGMPEGYRFDRNTWKAKVLG